MSKMHDMLSGVTKDAAVSKDDEKHAPKYIEEAQAVLDAIRNNSAGDLSEALETFFKSADVDADDSSSGDESPIAMLLSKKD